MVIERTVKELLDGGARRVIIPGFGAFLRRGDGSLTFSALLTADDGALREATARTASLGDRQAATAVADYSHSLREALAATGEASVAGVGTIFRHDDGKVAFIPAPTAAAPAPMPAEAAETTTADATEAADSTMAQELAIPHTGCTRRLRTALYGDRDDADEASAQEVPAAPGETGPCDDNAATAPGSAEGEACHGTSPEGEPASPEATATDAPTSAEYQSVPCPAAAAAEIPATPETASARPDDTQKECAENAAKDSVHECRAEGCTSSPAAEGQCRAEESACRMNTEEPAAAAPVHGNTKSGSQEYTAAADNTHLHPEEPHREQSDDTPLRPVRNDRRISRAALFGPEEDDAEADMLHAAAPEATDTHRATTAPAAKEAGTPHSATPSAAKETGAARSAASEEAAAEPYRPQVNIRRPERPRRKVDFVVVLAVAAAIIALSVLVYGYLTERNIDQQEIILFDPADTAEPTGVE